MFILFLFGLYLIFEVKSTDIVRMKSRNIAVLIQFYNHVCVYIFNIIYFIKIKKNKKKIVSLGTILSNINFNFKIFIIEIFFHL
jgi:hypothetical protein